MNSSGKPPTFTHRPMWFALAIACAAGACTLGSRQPGHELPPVGAHAVQSARLRFVMDELQRERMTLWPQEIENHYPTRDSRSFRATVKRASELAERLGETAERIPDALTGTNLPEVDRRSFMAIVQTLKDQIARFRAAANDRDLDSLAATYRSIDATCDSCHRRFRDVAGPR